MNTSYLVIIGGIAVAYMIIMYGIRAIMPKKQNEENPVGGVGR